MAGRVDVVRISPDGARGYATNAARCRTVTECIGSSGISVFDAKTNRVVATLQLGDPFFGGPRDIAVAPNGDLVFVLDNTSRVTSIDAGTIAVTAVRPYPCCVNSITLTPDGSRAYLSSSELGSGVIEIVNPLTGNALGTIVFPGRGPGKVAFSPDGRRAYVPVFAGEDNSFQGDVAVIDTGVHAVVATVPIPVNPSRVVISPDGRAAYVSAIRSPGVAVISTATNVVIGEIPIGEAPRALAIGPHPPSRGPVLGHGDGCSLVPTCTSTPRGTWVLLALTAYLALRVRVRSPAFSGSASRRTLTDERCRPRAHSHAPRKRSVGDEN
jgi:YVTN family beta-propeller protein